MRMTPSWPTPSVMLESWGRPSRYVVTRTLWFRSRMKARASFSSMGHRTGAEARSFPAPGEEQPGRGHAGPRGIDGRGTVEHDGDEPGGEGIPGAGGVRDGSAERRDV